MWKRLRAGRKDMAAAAAAAKGSSKPQQLPEESKEADIIGTPATAPLGYEDEPQPQSPSTTDGLSLPHGGAGVPRAGSDGSQSEYFDAQELYAEAFKLRREQARLREELAKKRFREQQLQVQLEDVSEERARLEGHLIELVDDVHTKDVQLTKLEQEKAEAEALLQALADYHESQAAEQQQQEQQREQSAEKRGSLASLLLRRKGGSLGSGGPAVHGRLLFLFVTALPGMGLLLLLLLAAAAFPAADHRLLGGLGSFLFDPRSAFWRNRASGLARLGPGGGVLRQGEYLRSCRQRVLGIGSCGADAHVLHLGPDGNLVLYAGHSPSNHGAAVWATAPLSSYKAAGVAADATYRALVDSKGVLQVVKQMKGQEKAKESVVFSRPVSRLPPALVRLGLVAGK